MNDLLEQFLAETRELVQSATDDLLALEGTPGDPEALNGVFRAFHTLKGSVGLFDYPAWFALLHAAEDGLSAARSGTVTVDAVLIDLSLETLDATARWADAVETSERLPDRRRRPRRGARRTLPIPPVALTRDPDDGELQHPGWASRLVAALMMPAGSR